MMATLVDKKNEIHLKNKAADPNLCMLDQLAAASPAVMVERSDVTDEDRACGDDLVSFWQEKTGRCADCIVKIHGVHVHLGQLCNLVNLEYSSPDLVRLWRVSSSMFSSS